MPAPRGFALAAVLATLVLMMMLVAVSAQRALLAARQGVLAVERVEVAVAVEAARAAIQGAPVDTVLLKSAPAGLLLANGVTEVGGARAAWELRVGAGGLAVADITGLTATGRVTARSLTRAVFAATADRAGLLKWVPEGTVGWVRLPSP